MASSDNENHASKLVNDQEITEEIAEEKEEKEKEKQEAAAPAGGGAVENSLRSAPKKDEYWRYIPLQKAALEGDWETAKKFFNEDDNGAAALTGAKITPALETVLHVAVYSGRSIDFVKKLVDLMPTEALRQLDIFGFTALHSAAWVGNTKAAVILVHKHSALLYMRDKKNWLPIHISANKGHKVTLSYLLRVTEEDDVSKPFADSSGVELLYEVVASKFYGE